MGFWVELAQRAATGLVRETPKRSAIFYQYFKAELAPPGPKEWPAVEQGFRNVYRVFHDQSWKEMSTREVWRYTLVGIEVGCWFWIGEIIGRGNFYGYVIPHTYHHPQND